MLTEQATVSGIATAAGVVSLTGSILGLQYDALLFGLFGGLISLMHLAPTSMSRTAGTLASAAMLGAIFSPVAVAVTVDIFDFAKLIAPMTLRLSAAFAIGLTAQIIIPAVFKLIQRKGESL